MRYVATEADCTACSTVLLNDKFGVGAVLDFDCSISVKSKVVVVCPCIFTYKLYRNTIDLDRNDVVESRSNSLDVNRITCNNVGRTLLSIYVLGLHKFDASPRIASYNVGRKLL